MGIFNSIRSYFRPINSRPVNVFKLSNPSLGILTLKHAPDGWEKTGNSYERSSNYSGVFRKYSIDKLGFVKEGKAYLEQIEREQGFEAEVTIIILEWDSVSLMYLEVFRGNIQLIDKDVDELKYTVPITDSSFENKVLNRDKEAVIVTKKRQDEVYKSLDGGVISGFANENILITLPSRIDFLDNTLEADRTFVNISGQSVTPPLIKIEGEDSNVKSNTNSYASIDGAFYANSTGVDVNIDINGSFNFKINLPKGYNIEEYTSISLQIFTNTDTLIKTIYVDYDYVFVRDFLSEFGTLSEYIVSGKLNIKELINATNYCQFVVGGTLFSSDHIFDFSLRTQGGVSPQRNIEAVLRHEEYARILQKITGVDNPFYSDYFGRKDSEPRKYNFNGKGSLRATTNGALIRGFKMTNQIGFDDVIAPLSVSLKDQFDSDNTIDPIGLGIEDIDGQKTVRIEELKYFYDTRVCLFIDNATNIEKEYNKDVIYNSLEIGYSKSEADEVADGIYDYNNKANYANAIISTDKKLTLVSKYSASNASINAARKETKQEKPTTDSKYDNTNFIIEVVENVSGNSISNGNAEQGTSDWSTTGAVTVENLVGSNRFVIPQNNGGQASISQSLGAIDQPVLSLSYHVLSENNLTVTPTFRITAILSDSSEKSLNQNGEWVDGVTSYPMNSIETVKESSFQSMNKFQISAADILNDIVSLSISFDSAFLSNLPEDSTNRLIVDDIYLSDSGKYKARTTEGFDLIEGIVNSNSSYNINLSPARSLIRHGFKLRAFLDDKQNTSYVFSDSEKLSNLVSRKTDESESVAESTDIQVSTLDEPIWDVELITMDVKFSTQQKKDITSSFSDGKKKIYGLVAYRENKSQKYSYGWIKYLATGGYSGDGSVELIPISKYINVATVNFMRDDDGAIFTDDDGAKFTIEF